MSGGPADSNTRPPAGDGGILVWHGCAGASPWPNQGRRHDEKAAPGVLEHGRPEANLLPVGIAHGPADHEEARQYRDIPHLLASQHVDHRYHRHDHGWPFPGNPFSLPREGDSPRNRKMVFPTTVKGQQNGPVTTAWSARIVEPAWPAKCGKQHIRCHLRDVSSTRRTTASTRSKTPAGPMSTSLPLIAGDVRESPEDFGSFTAHVQSIIAR